MLYLVFLRLIDVAPILGARLLLCGCGHVVKFYTQRLKKYASTHGVARRILKRTADLHPRAAARTDSLLHILQPGDFLRPIKMRPNGVEILPLRDYLIFTNQFIPDVSDLFVSEFYPTIKAEQ